MKPFSPLILHADVVLVFYHLALRRPKKASFQCGPRVRSLAGLFVPPRLVFAVRSAMKIAHPLPQPGRGKMEHGGHCLVYALGEQAEILTERKVLGPVKAD